MMVEENNLSVAWAKVFLQIFQEGEVSPVVVVVRDIGDEGPLQDPQIRVALDQLLEEDGKGLSCNTVANTIFPSFGILTQTGKNFMTATAEFCQDSEKTVGTGTACISSA